MLCILYFSGVTVLRAYVVKIFDQVFRYVMFRTIRIKDFKKVNKYILLNIPNRIVHICVIFIKVFLRGKICIYNFFCSDTAVVVSNLTISSDASSLADHVFLGDPVCQGNIHRTSQMAYMSAITIGRVQVHHYNR